MLVPLLLLAFGAVVAGFAVPEATSSARSYKRFWRACAGRGAQQPHPACHARGAGAGSAGRRSSPWRRASRCPTFLHRGAGAARRDGQACSSRSTCSCSTSGTSTSCTTGSSCARASGSAGVLWKQGDGAIIDGLGADNLAARVLWTTGRIVKLQTGYVYHYAFAMLIGVALLITCVHVQRQGALAGRCTIPASASSRSSPSSRWPARCSSPCLNKEAKGNARWVALYTTLFTFGVSLYIWVHFDPANAGFQFVEEMEWLGGSIKYKMGVDGISMLFVILTTFLMPLCIMASWEVHRRAREGVHDRLPGARDADDRRVLRAGSRAVLPVLRGRPDPDVPDHRRVGRQAARVCELQVLPLHAAGLGADAARHDGDVLARRHHRHPDAADPQVPATTCSSGCGWPSSPRSP